MRRRLARLRGLTRNTETSLGAYKVRGGVIFCVAPKNPVDKAEPRQSTAQRLGRRVIQLTPREHP